MFATYLEVVYARSLVNYRFLLKVSLVFKIMNKSMKVIDENALKEVDFKKSQRNEPNLELTS